MKYFTNTLLVLALALTITGCDDGEDSSDSSPIIYDLAQYMVPAGSTPVTRLLTSVSVDHLSGETSEITENLRTRVEGNKVIYGTFTDGEATGVAFTDDNVTLYAIDLFDRLQGDETVEAIVTAERYTTAGHVVDVNLSGGFYDLYELHIVFEGYKAEADGHTDVFVISMELDYAYVTNGQYAEGHLTSKLLFKDSRGFTHLGQVHNLSIDNVPISDTYSTIDVTE